MIAMSYRFALQLLSALLMMSLLFSCSSKTGQDAGDNLMAIAVTGIQPLDHGELNVKLQNILGESKKTDTPYEFMPKLIYEANAKRSLISIGKFSAEQHDAYSVTMIFDNVQGDDSVGGYRYDIELTRNLQGVWQVVEATKSWRCWPGRGHRDFNSKPCL